MNNRPGTSGLDNRRHFIVKNPPTKYWRVFYFTFTLSAKYNHKASHLWYAQPATCSLQLVACNLQPATSLSATAHILT